MTRTTARPLPAKTIPPEEERSPESGDLSDEYDSRVDLTAMPAVALAVDDAALIAELRDALGDTMPVGRDLAHLASVVVVDARRGARDAVAAARHGARSDAAILAVVDDAAAASDAHTAGAFACVHSPIVKGELTGLLSSALDSSTTKAHAAHLARKLDLEAHLASIGRITTGLSHELANPLAVALTNLDVVREELAQRRLLGRGLLPEALDDLGTSLSRIQALIGNLRTLVRGDPCEIKRVPLAPIVEQVLRWAEEPLRGVRVEQDVAALDALTSPTLLAQILVNLVTNAAHAARQLPSPRVRLHVYASHGRVVVSVRDNGPGIPEPMLERIFEPFFTTRRESGGMGLGLALCREYARRMGALLSVSSAPGRGACFRLSLPTP